MPKRRNGCSGTPKKHYVKIRILRLHGALKKRLVNNHGHRHRAIPWEIERLPATSSKDVEKKALVIADKCR